MATWKKLVQYNSGDTVTVATPTASTHAATKSYVDNLGLVWSRHNSNETLYPSEQEDKVGIGTDNASTKLEIAGAHVSGLGMLHVHSSDHAYMSLDAHSSSHDSGIYFSENGTQQHLIGYDASENYLVHKNASNTVLMTLDGSGNATLAGELIVNSGIESVKNGSDSATSGSYLRVKTSSGDLNVWMWQLGASNQFDLWNYNAGGDNAWEKALTFTTTNLNATFGGSITTTSAGLANAPSLAIDNPSSSSYIHALEAFGANMTQGQTHIFCLGKEGSTKNTAVLGYKWDSAGSNDNLFTIEHWGTGALVTVDGVGNSTFVGKVLVGSSPSTDGTVNIKCHTNDWAGGIKFTSNDGNQTAIFHLDNSTSYQMMLNTNFYVGGVVGIGTIPNGAYSISASGNSILTTSSNTSISSRVRNDDTNVILASSSNGYGIVGTENDTPFHIWQNSDSVITIDTSGNSTFGGDVNITKASNTVMTLKATASGTGARLKLKSASNDSTYIAIYDNDDTSLAQIYSYGSAYGTTALRKALVFTTGGSTTALTLDSSQNATFAGAITAGAKISTGASLSGSWVGEFLNNSSSGHGLKVRGGDTSSHYAFYVQDINENLLLSVLGDGQVYHKGGNFHIYDDNLKLRIGAGQDLELWHDGTDSWISNKNTGKLKVFNNHDDDLVLGAWDNTQLTIADGENTFAGSVGIGGAPTDELTIHSSSGSNKFHISADGSNWNLRKQASGGSSNDVIYGTWDSTSVTFAGALHIPQDIFHVGDNDTALRFGDDSWSVITGNATRLTVNNSGTTFNTAAFWLLGTSYNAKVTMDGSDRLNFVVGNNGTESSMEIDQSNNVRAPNGHIQVVSDSKKFTAGVGGDIQMFHDGSNSHITNSTGHLKMTQTHSTGNTEFEITGSGYYHFDANFTSGDRQIARFSADPARPIALGWIDTGSKMSLYTPDDHSLVLGTGALGTNNLEINAAGNASFSGEISSGSTIVAGGVVRPSVNNDAELGTSSYTWKEIHNSGWFRQYGSAGMYWATHDMHFYAVGTGTIRVYPGGSNTLEIELLTSGGTKRGSLYANNSNHIGLLDAGGSWAYRIENDASHYWCTNDNTTRMELTNAGNLSVTGNFIIAADSSDGNNNERVKLGASADLQLWHNGTDSVVGNFNTGKMYLWNYNDGDTVIGAYDNAEITVGDGLTTFDGGTKALGGHIKLATDTKRYMAGAGDDLQMYHNGTDSYIDNQTGHLRINNAVDGGTIRFQTDDTSGQGTTPLVLEHNLATFNDKIHCQKQLKVTAVANASYGFEYHTTETTRAFHIYSGGTGDNGYFGGIDHGSGTTNFAIHSDASHNSYMCRTGAKFGLGTGSPEVKLDVHSHGTEVAAVFGMADDDTVWVSTRVAETVDKYGAYAFMVGSAAVDGVGSTNTTSFMKSTVTQAGTLKGDLKFYINSGDNLHNCLELTDAGTAILNTNQGSSIMWFKHQGTANGAVYGTGTSFGLLDQGGNWFYKHTNDVQHQWFVADVEKMALSSAGYLDAYRFRDKDNDNYYLEPAATSNLYALNVFSGLGMQSTAITGTKGITFSGTTTGADYSIFRHTNDYVYLMGGATGLVLKGKNSDDAFSAYNNSEQRIYHYTNNTERLRIDGDGSNNTSVKVLGPNASFEVQANATDSAQIKLLAEAGTYDRSNWFITANKDSPYALRFGSGVSTMMDLEGDSNRIVMYTNTDDADRHLLLKSSTSTSTGIDTFTYANMVLDAPSTGSVAIALNCGSNPSNAGYIMFGTGTSNTDGYIKHQTNGILKIRNDGATSMECSDANVVSGDFNDTSDIALKKDISTLSSGLNFIKQLRPVNFKWRKGDRDSSGFIAQEVATVMPENVQGDDYTPSFFTEDGIEIDGSQGKSVNTIGLVAYLTKAVQELSAELDTLKNG